MPRALEKSTIVGKQHKTLFFAISKQNALLYKKFNL